jgi:hypothetical protein
MLEFYIRFVPVLRKEAEEERIFTEVAYGQENWNMQSDASFYSSLVSSIVANFPAAMAPGFIFKLNLLSPCSLRQFYVIVSLLVILGFVSGKRGARKLELGPFLTWALQRNTVSEERIAMGAPSEPQNVSDRLHNRIMRSNPTRDNQVAFSPCFCYPVQAAALRRADLLSKEP